MTKILFVEKRYNSDGANPLVSAKWIELPDGGEEAFIAKHLTDAKKDNSVEEGEEINILEIEQKLVLSPETQTTPKRKLTPDDIVAIFSVIAFTIAVPTALFLRSLKFHGN
jgi:hypothetical protein